MQEAESLPTKPGAHKQAEEPGASVTALAGHWVQTRAPGPENELIAHGGQNAPEALRCWADPAGQGRGWQAASEAAVAYPVRQGWHWSWPIRPPVELF